MANTLLTPTAVTREALRILENNLQFAKSVNREYDDKFAVDGAKIGSTITIRKPNRYAVTTGAALSIQDSVEPSVILTIDTQDHVDTNFTSNELTLSLDDFAKRILKPKMAALANNIDYNGLLNYRDVYNVIGTPGVTPATALIVLQAGQRLNDEAVPIDDDRALIINAAANAAMVDALKGLFQSSDKISNQYTDGNMGIALGFKWSVDQNVRRHTVGALGGSPVVNGATQTGASIITNGWTAAVATRVKRGDVFTMVGCNAVNPQNKADTGTLRQFVATADAASDVSGNMTISIYPSITTSGAYQTCTASPTSGGALTFVGTAATAYPMNLGFHRDAFTLATVDLEDVGKYGAWCGRENYKGMSLRIARQFRIGTDDVPARVDVLYGWKTIYPELAVRLVG